MDKRARDADFGAEVPRSDTEGKNGSLEFGYEFKYWYQSRPVCTGLQFPMGADGNRYPMHLHLAIRARVGRRDEGEESIHQDVCRLGEKQQEKMTGKIGRKHAEDSDLGSKVVCRSGEDGKSTE